MRCALVWADELADYRFRPGHPLDPHRLELTIALIRAMGLAGDGDRSIVAPRDATEDELLMVHEAEYVRAVRRVSDDPAAAAEARFGLGTDDVPIVAGMHEMSRAVVGSTLTAAELVATGRAIRAFGMAGGLHHAHAGAASGFCVYNDLGVAIRYLQRQHGLRVLYIDYDAHHGDGVQAIFQDDPGVFTLSIHESGLYLFPATGFVDELGRGNGRGSCANIPLQPGTEDDSFLAAFDLVAPDIADAFDPDVIVLQAGCDAHALDPLTHLRGTTRLFEELVRRVVALADRHCDGRVVATGGGGYAIREVVPRAWTLTWATLCGVEPPEAIPEDWLRRARGGTRAELSPTLRDRPGSIEPSPGRRDIEQTNQRTALDLKRRLMPLLTR